MTNKEAIKYLIRPFATSTKSYNEYLKQKEAYDLAIKVLEDVDRLEEHKFSIGDVVTTCSSSEEIILGLTTGVDGKPWASVYSRDYDVPQMIPVSGLKYTGKHIDITNIFERLSKYIKGDKENEKNEISQRLKERFDRIKNYKGITVEIEGKEIEVIKLALKALKDIERLEDENHRNFVNSQHIISLLIEENKKLRGETE